MSSSLRRDIRPRGLSLQQSEDRLRRHGSKSTRIPVSPDDAYSYALRSALLTYLLQPRQKRLQHVPAPAAPKTLHKSSAMDLMTDLSGSNNSRSNRFPHDFMKALDKRATGILVGTEKMPEFSDPQLKRTMGVFLNAFKDPNRRRNLDQDRKMGDLLLFFYPLAVQELKKQQKDPADDSWKFMADRHLAMFVRLLCAIMRDHEWSREKPELYNTLQQLEKKLLMHDLNLAASGSRNGGAGGTTIEVEVPLSYEVKDMPVAMMVTRIFDKTYDQVQEDITQHKSEWTEGAALRDLKMYQQSISLKAKNTINADDFDTTEAYEAWKKNENHELPQMILSIMQSRPELAKTNTAGALPPQLQGISSPSDTTFNDLSRALSEQSESPSSLSLDHAFDFGSLNLSEDSQDGVEIPFVFIPPRPRDYYRVLVKQVMLHDIRNPDEKDVIPEGHILARKSDDLLEEIGSRWRVPVFSRRILFLEALKELYLERDISLDTVHTGLGHFKSAAQDKKKANRRSINVQELVAHWTNWTMKDITTYQQSLSAIRDNVLRDLYVVLQGAYEKKGPKFSPFVVVLEDFLLHDELLARNPKEVANFAHELAVSLKQKAAERYQSILQQLVPPNESEWEFYNVIQLGKQVVNICKSIKNRFSKKSDFFGTEPYNIFIEEVLPSFAEDARDLVSRIMKLAKDNDIEIPMQDGFDLYKELVEIRHVYQRNLPGKQFVFSVEDQLQDFVWKWIENTEANIVGWVENAVKQDQFQMGSEPGINHLDERHSVSIVDIFRSFKQTKDQIADLQWGNEYQNAKFMTAIAKAVGLGVAKYCEMLDQLFSKEMSRLTPEQEAQLRQTRQEKWMQLAKDAFNSKDKVEPYQFTSESLVKLNNVEYGMQNLDRLEKEMDVDRCAEIIRLYDERRDANGSGRSSQSLRRRLEKYVFTIKIIEAEDLKACDINGLSDPYVVLGDEFQKRLAKTRIIYGNLNPRWDETIDIVTQGPLNIVATIWDWDQLGDHDCVGRTSLKLDPSHFRDFMPREYWLDLDTQGRLLLRVSMEGERDDIQFHFGKAFRAFKRTERDMTRSITDKLSAYIRHILSRGRLRSLLSRGGITMSSAISFFNRNRAATNGPPALTAAEIDQAIAPLYTYFDDNFAIMKQTLTESAMLQVMTRVWKEVLLTIEALLVPPMSDKLSQQKPLTQQELDIVFKWLELLYDFFHAADETGVAHGVPATVLKSPKYQDILNLNFFYLQPTDDLIAASERMATASAAQHQEQVARLNRMSAPTLGVPGSQHGFGGAAGLVGSVVKRRKTVMLSRNLGTMRQAKEEKRKAAQAEPTDEYILRILRMRPEAERYLRDRARQKERLAAAQAAEAIVRQSLAGGGGRMVAGYSQFGR